MYIYEKRNKYFVNLKNVIELKSDFIPIYPVFVKEKAL